MANTMFICRTNMFQVKDEKGYEKLIGKLFSESNIHFWDNKVAGETFHGFGCDDSIEFFDPSDPQVLEEIADAEGVEDPSELTEEDVWQYAGSIGGMNDFYRKIQPLIADDDAFIMTTISWEKLRYVGGWTTVVTSKNISTKSLIDVSVKEARKDLGADFKYCFD